MSTQPVVPPPQSAIDILRAIFDHYALAVESGDARKWRQLEQDIAKNAPLLVATGAISLKDLVGTMADCDERAKGTSGRVGKSASEELRSFLLGDKVGEEVLDIPPAFSVQDDDVVGQSVSAPAQQTGLVTDAANTSDHQ